MEIIFTNVLIFNQVFYPLGINSQTSNDFTRSNSSKYQGISFKFLTEIDKVKNRIQTFQETLLFILKKGINKEILPYHETIVNDAFLDKKEMNKKKGFLVKNDNQKTGKKKIAIFWLQRMFAIKINLG